MAILAIGIIVFTFTRTPTYMMKTVNVSLDEALVGTPYILISPEERLFIQRVLSDPDCVSVIETGEINVLPSEIIHRLATELLPENIRLHTGEEVTVVNEDCIIFDYFIFDEGKSTRIMLTASLLHEDISKTISIVVAGSIRPEVIYENNNNPELFT